MKIRISEKASYTKFVNKSAYEAMREELEKMLKEGKITWKEFKRKMNI